MALFLGRGQRWRRVCWWEKEGGGDNALEVAAMTEGLSAGCLQ